MSLQLIDLSKRFGKYTAVDRIDLSLQKGEMLAFLGPNGSGKTTTVRMIAGLMRPDRGDVVLDGFSIVKQRREAKSRLGILPDNSSLFPHMTLEEHLLMEARVHGLDKAEAQSRSHDLLRYCGLWERRGIYAGQASVGMRKKLGISLAVIHLPPVVVLDEPFEGLDPISARQIRKLLERLVADKKMTLFITSHMLALVEDMVDRVAMISGGKLLRDVATADLRSRGISLQDSYLEAFDHETPEEVPFAWLS